MQFEELLARLRAVPKGELFRHNDAGDLPAHGVDHAYEFTLGARQKKTGKIARSRTDRASCPSSCALKEICYASVGPISWHWKAMGAWDSSGGASLDKKKVGRLASAAAHLKGSK